MLNRSNVVDVALNDGSIVQVEIVGGEELVGSRTYTFAGISQKVSAVASELSEMIRTLRPDAATLEMGFEVGIEEGALTAILVRGTSKANLKITLEWRRSATDPDPHQS